MTGIDATDLHRFVNTLDRNERFVLMLHYAEQLTITEISQVLDTPEHHVAATLDNLQQQVRRLVHPVHADKVGEVRTA